MVHAFHINCSGVEGGDHPDKTTKIKLAQYYLYTVCFQPSWRKEKGLPGQKVYFDHIEYATETGCTFNPFPENDLL